MNNPDERTAVEQFGKEGQVLRRWRAAGHHAGAAHVRPRPDRGVPREVRHGVPARLLGRADRRGPGRAPRARDLPAACAGAALFSGARELRPLRLRDSTAAASTRTSSPTAIATATSARSCWCNNAVRLDGGRIHTSTAINAAGGNDEPRLIRRTLTEALALSAAPGIYYAMRDAVAGHEYLRSGEEMARDGMYTELNGYGAHVFLDFRSSAITTDAGPAARPAGGRPCPILWRARRDSSWPRARVVGRARTRRLLWPACAPPTPRTQTARRGDHRMLGRRARGPGKTEGSRDECTHAAHRTRSLARRHAAEAISSPWRPTPTWADAARAVLYLARQLALARESMGQTRHRATRPRRRHRGLPPTTSPLILARARPDSPAR